MLYSLYLIIMAMGLAGAFRIKYMSKPKIIFVRSFSFICVKKKYRFLGKLSRLQTQPLLSSSSPPVISHTYESIVDRLESRLKRSSRGSKARFAIEEELAELRFTKAQELADSRAVEAEQLAESRSRLYLDKLKVEFKANINKIFFNLTLATILWMFTLAALCFERKGITMQQPPGPV